MTVRDRFALFRAATPRGSPAAGSTTDGYERVEVTVTVDGISHRHPEMVRPGVTLRVYNVLCEEDRKAVCDGAKRPFVNGQPSTILRKLRDGDAVNLQPSDPPGPIGQLIGFATG